MSSIAKTSISLSKKDLVKSRIPPVASRSVVFYHKATAGQITINLNSLTMPSEMPTQVQATNDEISGARLTLNKKNLSVVSSANGALVQGLDYIVVDSYTLKLIGVYASTGAEADEIFVGTIVNSPISDLAVISARDVIKTMTVSIGQTTVNLGNEYKVGANPLEDVGAVKIWINGILALRDQDYTEVDSGNGFGSTIELTSAPVSLPWQLVAEFGIRAVTDQDALGTIESLSGAIVKISNDLADVAGTDANDYLTANPSDIERRTFGDMVLDHEERIDELEAAAKRSTYVMTAGNAGEAITIAVTNIPFIELEDPSNIWNGSQLTMPYTGIVDVDLSYYGAGGGNWSVIAYVDGVATARILQYATNDTVKNGSWKKRLNVGQVLSFKTQNIGGSLLNDPIYHWMNATIREI